MGALDLIGQALRLRPEAFALLETQLGGLRLALWVVFSAGLSSALGQSLVLFVNRVTPRRLIASLVVSAGIFAVSFLFWVASIWLVAGQLFDRDRLFIDVVRAVGLAYAPQLFGFFALTPYLRAAITAVLSIWLLLATLVATQVVFGIPLAPAVASAALGWLLLQVGQRTVGRPLVWLTRRLRQAVARHCAGPLPQSITRRPRPLMPLLDILTFLGVVLVAILVFGALAPLETLGWWAGWFGRPREATEPRFEDDSTRGAQHYLVFLSSIHSVAGAAFARREIDLLERLREQLPAVEVLEVFPYSVTNRALTGQRAFAWFWRWALSMKLSNRALAGLAGSVINLRNLWQVAVSADRRYGPLYNHGSADLIVDALLHRGYDLQRVAYSLTNPPESPHGDQRGVRLDPVEPFFGMPLWTADSIIVKPAVNACAPITLVGYSGGGQIAVGAAGHLKELIDADVSVIALGGLLSADPGLDAVQRLYYLAGRKDRIHRFGTLLFPGRWPVFSYSSWNQAKAQGRVRIVDMGPVDHTGRGGYLDNMAILPDGRSHLQQTVEVIAGFIQGRGPPAMATGTA